MDKICIVKLRKRMEHTAEQEGSLRGPGTDAGRAAEAPVLVSKPAVLPEAPEEKHHRDIKGLEAGQAVALTLTREQMQDLASSPRLMSLLSGKFTGDFAASEPHDEPLVVQFQFASELPLRLLKSSEVVQMLRISQHYLSKVVKEGNLKSYKVGKLRRFLLDDIISYLNDNKELVDLPGNPRTGEAEEGFLEQYIQEV